MRRISCLIYLMIVSIHSGFCQIDTTNLHLLVQHELYVPDGFSTNPRPQPNAPDIPKFKLDSSYFSSHGKRHFKILMNGQKDSGAILKQIKTINELPSIDVSKHGHGIPMNRRQQNCPEDSQRTPGVQGQIGNYRKARGYLVNGKFENDSTFVANNYIIKIICYSQVLQYFDKKIFLKQLIR